LVRSDESDLHARFQLARSYNNQGHLDRERGHGDRAIAWHRAAAGLQKELVELLAREPRRLDDDDRGFPIGAADIAPHLASSHLSSGVLLTGLERPDEALAEHGEAIKRLEVLARDHPGVADFQGDLALALNYRGLLTGSRGDLDVAESLFTRLLTANPGDVR